MADERANRKMSAILSADVKGYSRLMSVDEEGTVKALNECREIIAKSVSDHRVSGAESWTLPVITFLLSLLVQ
jgi:class 3 adenylate cyclase